MAALGNAFVFYRLKNSKKDVIVTLFSLSTIQLDDLVAKNQEFTGIIKGNLEAQHDNNEDSMDEEKQSLNNEASSINNQLTGNTCICSSQSHRPEKNG